MSTNIVSVKATTNNLIRINVGQQNNCFINSIKYNNPKNTHLMKFIDNYEEKSPKKLSGKRCFQQRTAVSGDSPDQFKLFSTVVVNQKSRKFSPNQTKIHSKCSFNPQRNYFNVNKQAETEQFTKDYTSALQRNSNPFNKKVSQYSQFVDLNVNSQWGNQYPLMGFQRTSEGRRLNNFERDRIIDLKQKTQQSFLKTFHTNKFNQTKSCNKNQLNTSSTKNQNKKSKSLIKQKIRTNNDLLFSHKTKLRSDRNLIANKLHMDTQSYLLRDRLQHLQSYHSNQINYENPQTKKYRPQTSQIVNNKSKTSISQKDKLNQILKKYEENVYKTYLKNENQIDNDITKDSKKQMQSNIQQWANKTCMQRLSQCSSPIKTVVGNKQLKNKIQSPKTYEKQQ